MTARLRAVRGATRLDDNTPAAITTACAELVRGVLELNDARADDVVSIVFTSTDDLDAQFPALALRGTELAEIPMLCARELSVPHGPVRTIRLLAHIETSLSRAEIRHAFLRGSDEFPPDPTTIPEGT